MVLRIVLAGNAPPITSDESLYLSEAVSIADGRIEYASGDPITHRPPLFPALLAPFMKFTGGSIDATRIVPIVFAFGALAAMYWFGRLTVGHRAACAGVALAAAAAGPADLASRFFVDTAATTWLFASAAVLIAAARSTSPMRFYAAGGAFLALAFLTKETAAAWVSMPIALAMVGEASPHARLRGFAVCYAAFAVLTAPWFIWVAVQSDTVFKLDTLPLQTMLIMLLGGIAGAAVAWRSHLLDTRGGRTVTALAVVAAWCGFTLLVLESRAEPHTTDYLANVPAWIGRVFTTNVEPWPVVAAAWICACLCIRNQGLRTILIFAAIGSPLVLYVANQGWELRQVIWLVYLSYLLVGWATLEVIDRVAKTWSATERNGLMIASIIGIGAIAGLSGQLSGGRPEGANWANADEQEIAGWVDRLADGSSVVSTRLYSSQLYVDAGGRVPIRQLSTLGVTVGDDGTLAPFGTLFRYEDSGLDVDRERHWISIRRYNNRPYAVGLAEEDLLEQLGGHQVTHLLLTGEDAGFSSLDYRQYFDQNPAFTRLHESDASGAVLYAVNLQTLEAQHPPLTIRHEDLAYLAVQVDDTQAISRLVETAAPSGALIDGTEFVPASELPDVMRRLAAESQ